MALLLRHISLPLAPFTLEVDVEINARVTAIFGPSGAGKTSLLDLVAGLRHPASALIEFNGEVLTNVAKGVFVPPRLRGIGYVPQDLALFPHLSVRGNLQYARRAHREASPLFSFERVVKLLDIAGLVERGIAKLSGGEKQRVALARALLSAPRLLLLDEPLGNLDSRLKERVIPYLARIRDEFKVPMLYVTHDRSEATALADKAVVLVDGKVVRTGVGREVLQTDFTE